jgi:pSer/pThr/pTyr-binding forkhead associated (FHA) protein
MDVKLRVIKGSQRTAEIVLRREETFIGRQSGCGLRIPAASVSRLHCRLCAYDGRVTVEDLGSANGSFLNGVRISGVAVVRPGDQLEIGPVVFVVDYQPGEGGGRRPQGAVPLPAGRSGERTIPLPPPAADDDIPLLFDAEEEGGR